MRTIEGIEKRNKKMKFNNIYTNLISRQLVFAISLAM